MPTEVPPGLDSLTRREEEVLSQVASGASTLEIAQRLFISVTTVRHHVQHILEKLHVHHRLGAVVRLKRAPEPPLTDDDMGR
jgi:DNA-binding NarL/FixJ family response regulator